MLSLERFCHDIESCIGLPYALPGEAGLDGPGLMQLAFARQGRKLCCGTAALWHEHLACKGRITGADALRRGMVVFTRRNGDLQPGGFDRIGFVTCASPLRIIHASAAKGCVCVEDAPEGWTHWGLLRELPVDVPQRNWNHTPILRLCARGNDVVRLQLLLRNLDYRLEPDGILGPMTCEALKTFQATHGLPATGATDADTWRVLEACG